MILALPCGVMVWHAETILVALGQDPRVSADGQSYLRYVVWGLLPGLWQVVLSEFLAAHARPRATLVVTLLGIGLNALADYALMFGNFGFPRLGLDGAGIASALVNTFMFLALLAFVLGDRRLRRYRLLGLLWRIEWPRLREIVRIGLPHRDHRACRDGHVPGDLPADGAHRHHGAGRPCGGGAVLRRRDDDPRSGSPRPARCVSDARSEPGTPRARPAPAGPRSRSAEASPCCPPRPSGSRGRASTGLILDRSRPENEAAFDLAVTLLAVAAFFQLADALQIVARGVLQGLKDTRVPMLFTLATSWGVGLPAAAFFGIGLGLGGEGIWAGLAAAMIGACVLLIRRFRMQARALAA